jgi:hypothetical protein
VTTRRAWQTAAHLRYGVTRGRSFLPSGRTTSDESPRPARCRRERNRWRLLPTPVRSQEQNGTPGGVEPGSLAWMRHKIEEVKAGLRDDPGRAYSGEFTAAAEVLREHDPVQFRSLRSLLKTKLIRLGEFDRLVEQRRRESEPLMRWDEHRVRRGSGRALSRQRPGAVPAQVHWSKCAAHKGSASQPQRAYNGRDLARRRRRRHA